MNSEIKEINHLEETNCCSITSYRQRLYDLITKEIKTQAETRESLLSTTSLNILLKDWESWTKKYREELEKRKEPNQPHYWCDEESEH